MVLNQMPDQVRHNEMLNQVQHDGIQHDLITERGWGDEILNQSRVGARDDVVQHDGIQHDLITERGWDYEILKQVQDD